MGVSSLWRKRIFEFLTFSDSLFQMDIDSLVCVALTTNLQRFSSSISSPFSSIQKDPLASGPPSIRLFFPIPFVPSVSSVQREREREVQDVEIMVTAGTHKVFEKVSPPPPPPFLPIPMYVRTCRAFGPAEKAKGRDQCLSKS